MPWQYKVSKFGADLRVQTGPGIGKFELLGVDNQPLGWIIGFPIDLRSRKLITGPYRLPLREPGCIEEFARRLTERLGGRFLWVANTANVQGIFPDMTASIPCVYDAVEKVAAGSPKSLLTESEFADRFDETTFRRMRIDAEGWLPGGGTVHDGVRRLLPNHWLDLTNWRNKRFRTAHHIFKPTSVENAANTVIQTVQAQIEALVSGPRKPALALTAGRDSRMVLAASHPFRRDVDYVTLASEKNDCDTLVPRRITAEQNLSHIELPFRRATPEARSAYIRAGGNCVAGANSWFHPSVAPLADTHVFVGGTGGELSRGFFWNKRNDGKNLTGSTLLRRMGLPRHDETIEVLDEWIANTGTSEPKDLLDMAYLEFREGCWASVQFPCDMTLVRVQPLLAAPAIFSMLGIDAAVKRSASLTDKIIASEWPSLASYGFNTLGTFRDTVHQMCRVAGNPEVILRRLRRLAS